MQKGVLIVTRATAAPAHVEDFPGLSGSEGLYPRIVEDLRDSGLSGADVARIVDVAERQVRNWASGGNTPSGRNRDRLLELHYVAQQLRDVYSREGSEIWLHGRKRSLAGQRPIDLLAKGAFQEVLDAVERLNAGAV
jgi:transcriptional regulator with XRE-family HTH domain